MTKHMQILLLQNRIEDLEFLLCAGNHDYATVDTKTTTSYSGGMIDFYTVATKRCKKCHKQITSTEYA